MLSWIGSVYGWEGVRSIISAEGLRWCLRSAAANYIGSPFFSMIFTLSLGVGLWLDTGLWRLLAEAAKGERTPSRRERRALGASAVATSAFVALVALATIASGGIVRSITGAMTDSPLADGAPLLLALGLGVSAVAYAYTAGIYSNHHDILHGMAQGLRHFARCFVTLFFVVQLFSTLQFTGLMTSAGIHEWVTQTLRCICCLLTLAEVGRE